MPSASASAMAWVVRNRSRMPGFVRSIPHHIQAHPRGVIARLAYLSLGGDTQAPAATSPPDGAPKVLVGPANHAGQGTLWARALESARPGLGARSLAVDIPGGFAFHADSKVPFSIYHLSRRWQKAERSAVLGGFDHVLIESLRPIFGGLYDNLEAEVAAMTEAGLSPALIAHGTDVRSPRAHLSRYRWSPFGEDPRTARLEETSRRNRDLAQSLGLPVFVSTPDLLDDLPSAAWCPVVVDATVWRSDRPVLDGTRRPVVVHIPSSAAVKGTALIEPPLRALEERGVLEYRRLEGVPSSRMPEMIGDADVVLDQFRLGSYGVAACEAMAAGRLVIGHVRQSVRDTVEQLTGQALPILEADPDTIGDVLLSALTTGRGRDKAADGPRFIDEVHSGTRSAATLLTGWIDRTNRD